MDERAAYQSRRLALLSARIDLSRSIGLEVGACDLPTVPENIGPCRYADFRTPHEMTQMWHLAETTVCSLNYVLSRERSVVEQVDERFDYVIACHVLEHVPDVISYLNDLKLLLNPGERKVILVTVPDKRATLDRTRPSTTVDKLLSSWFERSRYPSFESIFEFHRHWVGYSHGSAPLPLRETYEYARRVFNSGVADAHCHVWEDQQFLTQCNELIEGGFLPGLKILHFEPFVVGTNEFAVLFQTNGDQVVAA